MRVTTRRLATAALATSLFGSVGVAGAVTSGGPPAAPVTHKIPGNVNKVSCGSTTACFAISQEKKGTRWGVTRLASKGASVQVALISKKDEENSISCPNAAGCAVLGTVNSTDVPIVIHVDKSGKITKPSKVHAPVGAGLDSIACHSSVSRCEVAGGSLNVVTIVTLKGSKSNTRTLKLPTSKVSSVTIQGLSCASSSHCEAVGLLDTPKGFKGFVLSIHKGAPGKWAIVPRASGTGLTDVTCPHAGPCYSIALGSTKDLVDTLVGTKVTHSIPAPASTSFNDIACRSASRCDVVGVYFPEGASEGEATIIPIDGTTLAPAQHTTVATGYTVVGALKGEIYAIDGADLFNSIVSAG